MLKPYWTFFVLYMCMNQYKVKKKKKKGLLKMHLVTY